MGSWGWRSAPSLALPCLTNRRRQRSRSELGSGGADLSELSGEAGREESDPYPKLTNLPRRDVKRAGWLRGTSEKGRGGTGQSRGGRPDCKQECRGPRAAGSGQRRWIPSGGGGRRRGRQRAAVEPRNQRQAGRTERGGPETARAAQSGKWPRPPPSASAPLEKTGLKGTPGTSGPGTAPLLTPTSTPPLSL